MTDEIWKAALADLPPYLRGQILAAVDPDSPPPLFDFLVDALEKDAAIDKPGPVSSVVLRSNLLERLISDPALWPLPQAIRLARAASRLDDRMDDRLLRRLTGPPRTWPDGVAEFEMARVLEVIDAISKCERLLIPLMKFAKLRSDNIRSKAIKLMARSSRNPGWADIILADPDPRVRANLIEGIAAQHGENIEALLRKGAKDPHHRVALNALLALLRDGDEASRAVIQKIADDADPKFRTAAEWALRQIQEPAAAVPQGGDGPRTT